VGQILKAGDWEAIYEGEELVKELLARVSLQEPRGLVMRSL